MAETLNISEIRLYNLLKTKFGEKEAEDFVGLLKEQVTQSFENKKDSFATKEDINRLEVKLTQTETKLILWAFVFWVTQLGAIFAFIKLFIK